MDRFRESLVWAPIPYVRSMKWWGWGDDDVAFTHEDKPDLGPFLLHHLEIDVDRVSSPRVAFDDLQVHGPTVPPRLRAGLEAAVGAEHVSVDPRDRVVHARGKSLRDLVRHRRGDIGRLPDVVVRPGGEERSRRFSGRRSGPTPSSFPSAEGRTSRAAANRRRPAAGRSSRSTSAGWIGCSPSTRRRASRAFRPACSAPGSSNS
jgi:hypothetical protein